MRTIHKFILEPVADQVIELPEYASILRVGAQGDNLVMWAELDTEDPKFKREIRIFGTGHVMPENRAMMHLGSVQMTKSGFSELVWHVYEDLGEINNPKDL